MRYAICFTPPLSDPLALAGARWLGRSVFSSLPMEHPGGHGLGLDEIAFHTALPRRNGFHAPIMAPFRLNGMSSETSLLRELMHFAGQMQPVSLSGLRVGRNGDQFGLMLDPSHSQVHELAASVVQYFDAWRAPLSEAEIERRNPHLLSPLQFSNLSRWGHPFVLSEYRFQMPLTGSLLARDFGRVEQALKGHFDPVLAIPRHIDHIALFIEPEKGAPFQVHSLHPLGQISQRKRA